jgi:hypothetical protein
MGIPVITVAAGGLPVVETPLGAAITEAANGFGVAVTKVVGKPGLPVQYVTVTGAPGGGGGTTAAGFFGTVSGGEPPLSKTAISVISAGTLY